MQRQGTFDAATKKTRPVKKISEICLRQNFIQKLQLQYPEQSQFK